MIRHSTLKFCSVIVLTLRNQSSVEIHMYVLKMIACLKDIFMAFLNTGSYFS